MKCRRDYDICDCDDCLFDKSIEDARYRAMEDEQNRQIEQEWREEMEKRDDN